MFASSWFRPASKRQRPTTRLAVEQLEDRLTPSGGYLLVTSYDSDKVVRYDDTSGAFVDQFVSHRSGGLDEPYGVLFGPHDHNLYVTTGLFGGPDDYKGVLRYDGTTGAFLDAFTEGGHLDSPRGIIFGPDGSLYVADRVAADDSLGRIVRFHGTTGAFLDEFVPAGFVGRPSGLVFAPSVEDAGRLDLYVTSLLTNSISRFHGVTGAYLGEFVASGSGGLDYPVGLTFGPDGDLYVTSLGRGEGIRTVARFQGPSGSTPGAFLDTFVPPGSGGLQTPWGLLFGPDGNGDGHQDLYVNSAKYNKGLQAAGHTSVVLRYDGVTGAFLDTVVAAGSGHLDYPIFMTFTETDPVTLAYLGDRLTAASMPAEPMSVTLRPEQVQPLLTEALARWRATAVDVSGLGTIDVRIADLPGATLGAAVGTTIWLDDNAAGWGWFVDATPWDDSEFSTPGNQGEQNRMDLLTVLDHELGHLLGFDHDEAGVMQDTLATGMRKTPTAQGSSQHSALLDSVFAGEKNPLLRSLF